MESTSRERQSSPPYQIIDTWPETEACERHKKIIISKLSELLRELGVQNRLTKLYLAKSHEEIVLKAETVKGPPAEMHVGIGKSAWFGGHRDTNGKISETTMIFWPVEKRQNSYVEISYKGNSQQYDLNEDDLIDWYVTEECFHMHQMFRDPEQYFRRPKFSFLRRILRSSFVGGENANAPKEKEAKLYWIKRFLKQKHPEIDLREFESKVDTVNIVNEGKNEKDSSLLAGENHRFRI